MPAPLRRIAPEDILSDTVYAAQRQARRAVLLPVKRLRRVEVGPICTVHFESYDTMLFQVQEMLLVEKGGAEQQAVELAAYNPLIPQGGELVATAMFEVDDPDRRAAVLARLGGIEECFFLQIGPERIQAESDIGPVREHGGTSSVHFLRFPLGGLSGTAFRDPATAIAIGCDHERYAHTAMLSPATRAELAHDLA